MTAPPTIGWFEPSDGEEWDRLVGASVNGTFLHTRRYLSYHGDRFHDASLVVRGPRGNIVGVLAAAADPADGARVVSHPGLTYGGVVHDGTLHGASMIAALESCADAFAGAGFTQLVYKSVPHIYHRIPSGDDLYALFRLGAVAQRVDLSATIDLASTGRPDRNRRRNLAKAQGQHLRQIESPESLAAFWPLLTANLQERFNVNPVHSLGEIEQLAALFPTEITCAVAVAGAEVVAGVVHYQTDRVLHPQYSASSPRGREMGALDLLFQSAIDRARQSGLRYYDFGISNEQQGRVLNASLYAFKRSFGAGGVIHEHHVLDLSSGGIST